MKFRIVIDTEAEEEIVATVHERSELTDHIETMVLESTGDHRIAAWFADELVWLSIADIECITVLDGKTYAIDGQNRRCRLKQRLYEVKQRLPSSFIHINKSTLANEARLERFVPSFSGAVDAVFRCGYREYVSRRCFTQIKRRFDRL